MSSPANSDRPPTYQQVTASQEQLHKHHALHNLSTSTTSIVHTTRIKFEDRPVIMNCPHCGQSTKTVIEEENGAIVYLICILLALFCLFCGCCLIPFCISGLKDKIHICPRCHRPVGKKTLL